LNLPQCTRRLLGLLPILLTPTASAQVASPAYRAFAGCYTLTLSSWSKPYQYPQPPKVFRLDTAQADTLQDGTIYRVVAPNPSGFGKFQPRWAFRSPTSIEVFWSTGFAGVTLHLVAKGDTLSGKAQAFSDIEAPGIVEPSGFARAVRISCPQSLRAGAT
jgi:hypothetical protein